MSQPLVAEAPLRIGVVGLGFAGTTHLEAFGSIPGVEIVALAGQESDRLSLLGDRFRIPHRFADWRDLVAVPDLDVVSIGTPNGLHYPIAMAALTSGRHVFCEKPLALEAREAREMVAAAHDNDRVLEVAFNHRRRADVQWARSYLSAEGIGKIYHSRASWKRSSGIPHIGTWFTNKSLAGGGALIDLGPHVLDSLLFLLGEPRVVAVSAVMHGDLGRAVSANFEVEDLASALFRLSDGSSVALEITWAAYSADDEDLSIELLGGEGGLRLFVANYASSDTLRVYRDIEGRRTTIAPDVRIAGGEHSLLIGEFVDILRSGAWDAHRGDYALHRTEVLDACYRSALEGREVTL